MSWGKLNPSWRRFGGPVALTVGLLAVAPLLTASAPPTATTAHAAQLPYNACTRNSGFYASNPVQRVLNDEYTWASYPVTKVGDGNGDIDWNLDPYDRVSWRMWLHSLRWTGTALDAIGQGDERAAVHLKAVVRDWAADNPYPWNKTPIAQEATMHRTNVLLCLRTVLAQRNNGTLPAEDGWLDDIIMTHARSLEHYFSGHDNHGTDESLVMLGLGCLLDESYYRELALQRLQVQLGHAIYPDGSVNEQSVGYAAFNYSLWSRTLSVIRQCTSQDPLADTVATRLRALSMFLAHAMTPQGTFQQLGDTEDLNRPPLAGTPQEWAATNGASGRPPSLRVAVYPSGYVFGRSGWGDHQTPYRDHSVYSIRFGPKQAHHGHADHMSITYQAKGARILIDPGYGEYTRDAWQDYFKGPAAHNQLVLPGMGSARATMLTASTVSAGTPTADYFQLRDTPGTAMARTRDVLVLHDPDLMLVADQGSSSRAGTFEQLWHLDPGTTVATGPFAAVARIPAAGTTQAGTPPAGTPTAGTPAGGTPTGAAARSRTPAAGTPAAGTAHSAAAGAGAAAAPPAVTTTFLRLPYRGTQLRPAPPSVTSGSTQPIKGWWWPTIFTRQPAPVISMAEQGTAATMLTAVVPGKAGTTVRATPSLGGDKKTWVYTFTLATPASNGTPASTRVVQVGIRVDGSMYRIR